MLADVAGRLGGERRRAARGGGGLRRRRPTTSRQCGSIRLEGLRSRRPRPLPTRASRRRPAAWPARRKPCTTRPSCCGPRSRPTPTEGPATQGRGGGGARSGRPPRRSPCRSSTTARSSGWCRRTALFAPSAERPPWWPVFAVVAGTGSGVLADRGRGRPAADRARRRRGAGDGRRSRARSPSAGRRRSSIGSRLPRRSSRRVVAPGRGVAERSLAGSGIPADLDPSRWDVDAQRISQGLITATRGRRPGPPRRRGRRHCADPPSGHPRRDGRRHRSGAAVRARGRSQDRRHGPAPPRRLRVRLAGHVRR